MLKRQLTVRKSFMIFMGYFLLGTMASWWTFDRTYYKGPKYQAPETARAVRLFRQKCVEFKVDDICGQGFQNLVRIDLVDRVWYQVNFNRNITTIGLTEYSAFSPLTKISIDRRLTVDNVILDSTIVHELGHAIFYLEHDDSKVSIMNTEMNSANTLEANYESLVNEMFKDYADSLK